MRKFVALVLLYCSIPVLLLAGTGMETSYPAQALKFGLGVTDNVDIGLPASYNTQSKWSFVTLINLTVADNIIVSKLDTTGSLGMTIIGTNGLGDFRVYISHATTALSYPSTGGPIVPNRWQFVAATVDLTAGAGARAHIYVSSDLLSPLKEVSYATKIEPVGAQDNDSTYHFRFGNYDGLAFSLEGRMAIAGYSPGVVLNVNELLAWQQNPLLVPRGCQGMWIPGANGRGRVLDLSGWSNEGTITGAIPVEGLPLFARASRSYRNAAAGAAALLTRTLTGAGR